MTIPKWAQSSVDENSVSLTISSIGKAVAGFVTFLGMLGIVDPVIASQTWGNFVSQWITLVPALFSAYHSAHAVYGLIRKAVVRVTPGAIATPAVPPIVVSETH